MFGDENYVETGVKVGEQNERFVFKIETTGAMKPLTILKYGLSLLAKKLKTVNQNIEENYAHLK